MPSSFESSLQLDGKTYMLIGYSYLANKGIDIDGRLSSKIKGSVIELEIVTPEDDVTFYKWFVQNEEKPEGKIVCNQTDQDATFNTLTFQKAFCFSFYQDFNRESRYPMKNIIKISAGTIKFTAGSNEIENTFFNEV